MIRSKQKLVQTLSLSVSCLQTLDMNEQLLQRLLGRNEVPIYGDETVHRPLVHRLVFSFKLSLVSVIFSLKGRSRQIFRHLRTDLDRSNKTLLSFLVETSDPGVHNLVFVPVVDDIHPEMVGLSTANPRASGRNHITDLLEGNFTGINGLGFEVT